MPRALGRLLSLVLMVVVLAVLASPIVQAQLRPEVRDHTIKAAVQIAVRITATDGIDTREVPLPVGSGTIVSPDGLILTNWHVVDMIEARHQLAEWRSRAVAEGYAIDLTLDEERLLILVSDGSHAPRQKYTARVVEHDARLDLAVLQIDDAPESANIPFVPIGNSDDLKIGDPIDVFGFPLIGGDALTYTTGVVSGFNAEPGVGDRAWITTDASTSGGSSGGTAIDRDGRLIGIPTQAPFLDCRPGDSNLDGVIDESDAGCVPLGGSIGQLRPINLAKPLLERAGWVEPAQPQTADNLAAQQDAPPTNTPVPTNTAVPTSTPVPAPTNTPVPTNTPQPSPPPTPAPSPETQTPARPIALNDSANVPIERGNAARTGVMPGPDPDGELGVLWEYEIDNGTNRPPALVDGVLYLGTGYGQGKDWAVIAVDAASGAELWRRALDGFPSAPTVVNGRVYVTSFGGFLHVLAATDGHLLQSLRIENEGHACIAGSSPLVVNSQVVAAFGCTEPGDSGSPASASATAGILVAVESLSGEEQWRFRYSNFGLEISPAYSNGIVVVASSRASSNSGGEVHAIDVVTGAELWRFRASDGLASTPAIAESAVFVASYGGTIYALDLKSGMELWRHGLEYELGAHPVIADGLLFVSDARRNRITVIDAATGVRLDDIEDFYSRSALAVTATSFWSSECGRVYMASRDGGLSREVSELSIEGTCTTITAPVVSGRLVYLVASTWSYRGFMDGKLIAVGDIRVISPVVKGMLVEVINDEAVIRAAPSSGGVARGEVAAGTKAVVSGESEEREGQIWWPIEVEDVGSGWIQESDIIVAEVPPAPTPTPGATSAPSPTNIPVGTGTPVPTNTPLPSTSTPLLTSTPGPNEGSGAETQFQPTHKVDVLTSISFRQEPVIGADIIAVLAPGALLQFIGEGGDPESHWMKFRTESGDEGWILGSLVAPILSDSPTVVPESTLVAQATRIAELESQLATAEATAIALAKTPQNSVLDPNQQSISFQTNLRGMLGGNEDVLESVGNQLETILSRYPPGCRAGFVLASGNAPSIEQGIDLAERVEELLRELRSDIFTDETGFEHFAQPNVEPFGRVTIEIFFYSGCEPIG